MKRDSPATLVTAGVAFALLLSSAPFARCQSWMLTSAPTNEFWRAITSSANGARLAAVSANGIYASTNGGTNWTLTSAPAANWSTIASSTDGNHLVAAVQAGNIYISKNGGTTWDPTAATAPWQGIACSGDGTNIVAVYAVQFANNLGGISISINSGLTWNDITPTNVFGWYSVCSSADGAKLAAMMVDALTPGGPIGWIYTSTNAGSTWVQSTRMGAPCALACSADGTTLAAAEGGSGPIVGWILTSTNSGMTWTQANTPGAAWTSIATSADGTRIVAAAGGLIAGPVSGPMYTSLDSGATWMMQDPPTNSWASVASSADGCRLVAAVNGGGIYTWQTTPALVLKMVAASESMHFSWTVPSRSLVLQQTFNLAGNWTEVAAAQALDPTNVEYQVTIPRQTQNTYYRLASQ